MMFLSLLLIDVGQNPDRPRPGRLWLRNLYRVHQRLCMGFPSAGKVSDDPHFLKPFRPGDFMGGTQEPVEDGAKPVHVSRGPDRGFLFRIDPLPGGRVLLLVQSATRPDWDYAFRNAPHFLAAPPESRPLDLTFENGRVLRFRLTANPTRKIDTKTGPDGVRRNGKRVPVPDGELLDWLGGKAVQAGFAVDADATTVEAGYVRVDRDGEGGKGARLRSARYTGTLEVTDAVEFRDAVIRGFGSGKAFGFGLLSFASAPGGFRGGAGS